MCYRHSDAIIFTEKSAIEEIADERIVNEKQRHFIDWFRDKSTFTYSLQIGRRRIFLRRVQGE